MEKKTIELSLCEFVKGAKFINQAQLSKAMGVSRDTARDILKDLDFFKNKRTRYYLIKDVAIALERIKEC